MIKVVRLRKESLPGENDGAITTERMLKNWIRENPDAMITAVTGSIRWLILVYETDASPARYAASTQDKRISAI